MTPEEMQYVRDIERKLSYMLILDQTTKKKIETLEETIKTLNEKIKVLQTPAPKNTYCKVCLKTIKDFKYGRKYCSLECKESMAEEDAMIEEMRDVWSKAYGKVKYYLKDDKETSNRFRDRGKVYKELVYSKEITLDDFKKWIELELIQIMR